jgi:hypothetical protein
LNYTSESEPGIYSDLLVAHFA